MNHYLFKYAIEQTISLFKEKRVSSVSAHSNSSFSIRFKDCRKFLYVNLSSQSNFFYPVEADLILDKTNDTPFFVFLRKKLPGLILKDIEQTGSERYAYLFFEDVRGSIKNRFFMSVEMIDRMSNAVFCDDKFMILQAYKYTYTSRIIMPHKKYEPPITQMPDLLTQDTKKLLLKYRHKENILGLNGFLKKQLKSEDEFLKFREIAKETFENRQFELCVYDEKYVYPFCFLKNGKKVDESYIIEKFILKPQTMDFENKKKNLENIIKKRLDSIKRRIKKIEKELNNAQDAEEYRIIAENLLLHPTMDVKYKNKIELKDVYTSNMLSINLNPKMNIFENAQNYFKKFKKAKKGEKIIKKRLKDSRYELEFLEQLMFDIENAKDEKELADVKSIIIKESIIKTNTKKIKQTGYIPYEHIKIMGFDVYVGKNARGNDYVTMKLANKNDLWFHPHQRPGAHLILKNPSRLQKIDDNVKMKCACEVAKRTKGSAGEKLDIDYTFVKYVKKPKGLRVGLVFYSKFESLRVEKSESC